MRPFHWTFVVLSSISLAQAIALVRQQRSPPNDTDLVSAPDPPVHSPPPPPCARSCQERFPITKPADCTHQLVFTSRVTRCVQQTCPLLKDVLDWQTHYASVCGLKARYEATWELAASWALFGLASLTVIGRVLSRVRWLEGPGFWWDDWLVLGLWLLSTELAICLVYLRDSWTGRDAIGIVQVAHIHGMLWWTYITVPFYIIDIFGTKIAWVALYMRIWDFNTLFRKMCWITIFLLLSGAIGFTVASAVLYWPTHYYVGDSSIVRQSDRGIYFVPSVFGIAAINIAMDFWILFLPVPKLMSLTGVSKQHKTGICAIFLLGFCVTVVSAIRLSSIVPLKNTTNVTRDFGTFGTWSNMEAHLGMISCNLPAIAGLANRFRTRRKALREIENKKSTVSTSCLNRSPPKTPKLNTCAESSACTSMGRLSEEWYMPISLQPAPVTSPG